MRRLFLITICILANVSIPLAHAGVDAELIKAIGYDKLILQLGDDLPTGLNVPVTHVEASENGPINPKYFPELTTYQFGDKDIVDRTGLGNISTHSTGVATLFYSHHNSLAPDIDNIYVYEGGDWGRRGYLDTGGYYAPKITANNTRVTNHSYVSNNLSDTMNLDALMRMDYIIDEHQSIHVVGNGGAQGSTLFHHAFNAITVGRISLSDRSSTRYLDDVYVDGRTVPHIVVPESYGASDAAPILSSVVATMIEYSVSNPELSNSYFVAGNNIVQHAGTAQVIRSVLMAGADRRRLSTTIDNYHYSPSTDNNLDPHMGAGSLNVFNSYQMLMAGETDSFEDANAETAKDVGQYGFDYDNSFGGLNNSNNTATYEFTASVGKNILTASLNWHIQIEDGPKGNFDPSATLINLDLYLYDVTNPISPLLIDTSLSTINNSENIMKELINGHKYQLVVKAADAEAFDVAYGLAWRLTPDIGDFNGNGSIDAQDLQALYLALNSEDLTYDLNNDLVVNNSDLVIFLRDAAGTADGDIDFNGLLNIADLSKLASNFNLQGDWAKGDVNGDSVISIFDLAIIASNFGKATGGNLLSVTGELPTYSGPIGGGTTLIPEPTSLLLLCFGGLLTQRRRKYNTRFNSFLNLT